MAKKANLLRKVPKLGKNNCGVMLAVVVVLILVGVYFLLKNNGVLGNREGFEGAITNMNEKPNPKEGEVIMVLFFVDWCPHCKSVKPEWEKLMKLNNTKVNGKNIKIQAANAEGSEVEKEAARDNNVEGYPTIKLISQSEVVDYNGARNAEEMGKFVKDYCNRN